MWVILGCEFDAAMQMCTRSNSFHGYLSQISWYRKELVFDDIRVIFQNPNYVFYSDVFLVWKEYVLESGVDRVIPSEASGVRCEVRDTPCRFFTGLWQNVFSSSEHVVLRVSYCGRAVVVVCCFSSIIHRQLFTFCML